MPSPKSRIAKAPRPVPAKGKRGPSARAKAVASPNASFNRPKIAGGKKVKAGGPIAAIQRAAGSVFPAGRPGGLGRAMDNAPAARDALKKSLGR